MCTRTIYYILCVCVYHTRKYGVYHLFTYVRLRAMQRDDRSVYGARTVWSRCENGVRAVHAPHRPQPVYWYRTLAVRWPCELTPVTYWRVKRSTKRGRTRDELGRLEALSDLVPVGYYIIILVLYRGLQIIDFGFWNTKLRETIETCTWIPNRF